MTEKLVAQFEVKKDERTYVLSFPYSCPGGELYDVLFSMLQRVNELNNESVEKAKKSIDPEVTTDISATPTSL